MIFIIHYITDPGFPPTTPYCVVGCKTKLAAIAQMDLELGVKKLVDRVEVYSANGGMEVSNVW